MTNAILVGIGVIFGMVFTIVFVLIYRNRSQKEE